MLDALRRSFEPELLMFLMAEFTFILTRANDIRVLILKESQRKKQEQGKVESGLGRSLLLEGVVLVPISTAIVVFTIYPLARSYLSESTLADDPHTVYAILGVISYGFPLLSIKRHVTKVASGVLKEYAEILHDKPQ